MDCPECGAEGFRILRPVQMIGGPQDGLWLLVDDAAPPDHLDFADEPDSVSSIKHGLYRVDGREAVFVR